MIEYFESISYINTKLKPKNVCSLCSSASPCFAIQHYSAIYDLLETLFQSKVNESHQLRADRFVTLGITTDNIHKTIN